MSSRRRVSERGQGAMSGETEVKSEAQMAQGSFEKLVESFAVML